MVLNPGCDLLSAIGVSPATSPCGTEDLIIFPLFSPLSEDSESDVSPSCSGGGDTPSGPPNKGTHLFAGTPSRPEIDSGYKATTLAGFESSSVKMSIAASYFDALNWETAFNRRICLRLFSYAS